MKGVCLIKRCILYKLKNKSQGEVIKLNRDPRRISEENIKQG